MKESMVRCNLVAQSRVGEIGDGKDEWNGDKDMKTLLTTLAIAAAVATPVMANPMQSSRGDGYARVKVRDVDAQERIPAGYVLVPRSAIGAQAYGSAAMPGDFIQRDAGETHGSVNLTTQPGGHGH
jgi:hypothetical protein